MPMMIRINRYAVVMRAQYATGALQAALVRVVAPLAQRLPVGPIPEQIDPALMRDDVIHYR